MNHIQDVKVIVCKCVKDSNGDFTLSNKREESSFDTYIQARAYGDTCVAEGIAVIIRPTYNEVDSQGNFFREYRSIDGASFKEIKFRIK